MKKNLLVLQLALILLLSVANCDQICYGKPGQFHNIMEDPDIKKNLINGVMDFQSDIYTWYPQQVLPVPQESVYFRFQYKKAVDRDLQRFFAKLHTNNGQNYVNFQLNNRGNFQFSVFNDNKETQIIYNSLQSYQQLDEFQWIGLRISKRQLDLYYDNQKVKTVQIGADTDDFTLKQFQEIKYLINVRQSYGIGLGQMKNLQVSYDLNEAQFECINQSDNMLPCSSSPDPNNDQCTNNGGSDSKKNKCIRKASSLSETKLEGKGIYYDDQFVAKFQLKIADLHIPECVNGNIYDGNGNIVNYKGTLNNAIITYEKDQIQSNCYTSGETYVCRFYHVLEVYDAIRLIQKITFIRNASDISKNVSGSVLFKGRFQDNVNLQSQLGDAPIEGVIVKKNYHQYVEDVFQQRLEFYSSNTFERTIISYSYGNNIYAQVQVGQDLLKNGASLEFSKAYIYETEENRYEITPFQISSSNEGFLNLSFKTSKPLENTQITMDVYYNIHENQQSESTESE